MLFTTLPPHPDPRTPKPLPYFPTSSPHFLSLCFAVGLFYLFSRSILILHWSLLVRTIPRPQWRHPRWLTASTFSSVVLHHHHHSAPPSSHPSSRHLGGGGGGVRAKATELNPSANVSKDPCVCVWLCVCVGGCSWACACIYRQAPKTSWEISTGI
jgi:hypothetical protein